MENTSLSNRDSLIISVNSNSNFDAKKEDRPSNERKSFYPQIDYMSKDSFKEDVEYLKSMGFDEKMIIKVYILLKPKSTRQAELLMTKQEGFYIHRFYVSKRSTNDLCAICGKGKEYHRLKGEKGEKYAENEKCKLSDKKCVICESQLTQKEYENNKLQCEHISCDDCWFKYLSCCIDETKVSNIKCFGYKCNTDLTEEFISSKIQNKSLFTKYKKFKLKNEIMRSSNKKFCPFPDCDSYIERNEGDDKYVICKYGHKSCYICLQDWHGTKECEEELDKNFQIWKRDKVLKRCPKCRFYIEKEDGCNHMTCGECKYQWCWICEGEYTENHYDKGRCKGNQFIEANSLQEVENIRRERKREKYKDGNYCCSCCCIEMCADTNWSCSFIAMYIGIILLFVIVPIGFAFVPLSILFVGPATSVEAGEEIGDYKKVKGWLKGFLYFIQGFIGFVAGIYICGLLLVVGVGLYGLIWVIPVTNPFFSSWLIIRGFQDFKMTNSRDDYD